MKFTQLLDLAKLLYDIAEAFLKCLAVYFVSFVSIQPRQIICNVFYECDDQPAWSNHERYERTVSQDANIRSSKESYQSQRITQWRFPIEWPPTKCRRFMFKTIVFRLNLMKFWKDIQNRRWQIVRVILQMKQEIVDCSYSQSG